MHWVAGVLASALGCGSEDAGSELRTLTLEDVSNIPAGTAQGTAFAGTFQLAESEVLDCKCRVGDCSQIRGSESGTFTLTQTNGALTMHHRGSSESTSTGSIDADGAFLVGRAVTGSTQLFVLIQGAVVAGTSLNFESENTLNGYASGERYDCDFRGRITASYLSSTSP